jgi:hypothetical protein
MHWSFRLAPSNDFKDVEFIRNLNFSLKDWSSLNLLFNELIAISTITLNNLLQNPSQLAK